MRGYPAALESPAEGSSGRGFRVTIARDVIEVVEVVEVVEIVDGVEVYLTGRAVPPKWYEIYAVGGQAEQRK